MVLCMERLVGYVWLNIPMIRKMIELGGRSGSIRSLDVRSILIWQCVIYAVQPFLFDLELPFCIRADLACVSNFGSWVRLLLPLA